MHIHTYTVHPLGAVSVLICIFVLNGYVCVCVCVCGEGACTLANALKSDIPNTIPVFSSSATVYGSSPSPLSEDSTTGTGITNPYGQTKHMMEQVLFTFASGCPASAPFDYSSCFFSPLCPSQHCNTVHRS